MIPIPLRTKQQMKQFSPFTLNDENAYLDAGEIYTMIKKEDMRFLYPDSATKLITYFYKDIQSRRNIFDKIAENISTVTKKCIYKIDIYRRTLSLFKYKPVTKIFENKSTTSLLPLDADTYLMVQIDEGDFGHFCGAFYEKDTNTMFIFDSMMFLDHNMKIRSAYLNPFKKAISDIFDMTSIAIVCDYYKPTEATTDIMSSYSCEITGGSFRSSNVYICNIARQPINFLYDSYVMGVDNQNQYCWMWMLLYLLSKSIKGDYDWQTIHRLIVTHNTIPVVLIKFFTTLTLNVDFPTELRNSMFFKNYFNCVISNASTYRETFNPINHDFRVMKCVLGCQILKADNYLKDYRECVVYLVDHISEVFVDEISVQTQSSISVMKIIDYITRKKRFIYTKINKIVKPSSQIVTKQTCSSAFDDVMKIINDTTIMVPSSELRSL